MATKEGNKDIKEAEPIIKEYQCDLDEGPTTLLEDAQKRLQQSNLQPPKIRIVVACESVPIAVQRTTFAPPLEQISHLRPVRTGKFKIIIEERIKSYLIFCFYPRMSRIKLQKN